MNQRYGDEHVDLRTCLWRINTEADFQALQERRALLNAPTGTEGIGKVDHVVCS